MLIPIAIEAHRSRKSTLHRWLVLSLTFFVVGLVVGLSDLPTVKANVEANAQPTRVWPTLSRYSFGTRLPTLVVFLDPACEPSDDSINSLVDLQHQHDDGVDVLVFLTPSKPGRSQWTQTMTSIAALDRIQFALDESAEEANLFGAVRSGQSFLYDSHGQLLRTGMLQRHKGVIDLVPKSAQSRHCPLFENPSGES